MKGLKILTKFPRRAVKFPHWITARLRKRLKLNTNSTYSLVYFERHSNPFRRAQLGRSATIVLSGRLSIDTDRSNPTSSRSISRGIGPIGQTRAHPD